MAARNDTATAMRRHERGGGGGGGGGEITAGTYHPPRARHKQRILSACPVLVIFTPVRVRVLGGIGLLLAAACRGAAPGAGQARSDSAFKARTWGLAYLQQQQLPRAEAEFEKVVALAPDQALGYADLGLVYLREGRLRDAETQLRRAAALDSSGSDIGLMLAEVYRLTGRAADARREIDGVLRRDSTAIRALYALVQLAARSADPAER